MPADLAPQKVGLTTRELEEIIRAIDRKLVCQPLQDESLAAAGLAHLTPRLGLLLGLPPELARALSSILVEERARRAGPSVQLVWTGPEAVSGTARDTATVVRELFGRARKTVLVAGYAFDHGAEIFEALHEVMKQHQVEVQLFVDIPRPTRKEDAALHVRQWSDEFFLENWRFPLRPTIYFDPRSVTHEVFSSLHAKCMVVDERFALVTSANFTDRGQGRNIEVGAYIDDPRFSCSLVEQWRAALAAGVFVEVEVHLQGAGVGMSPE